MKKLFLAFFMLLGSLAFSQETTVITADQLTIHVGDDTYSMDVPATSEDSLKLNAGYVDLLNRLIAEYIANSAENKVKVETILANDNKIVKDVATVTTDIKKIIPPEPAKHLLVGGYLLTNPFTKLGGFNLSGGVELGFNIFNSLVVTPGLGIEVDENTARLQAKVSIAYWLF